VCSSDLAAGLCETGDARLDRELDQLLGIVVRKHLRNFWPRPNQRNIALEQIPEIWKFVKSTLAKPATGSCHAWIIFPLELELLDFFRRVFIGIEFGKALTGIGTERSKLLESKQVIVGAHALLEEQCGPGCVQGHNR